jgi:hypothetical protein
MIYLAYTLTVLCGSFWFGAAILGAKPHREERPSS